MARESEVDLDDLAKPIDTAEKHGRNLGGRPRGADVADFEDEYERHNARRRRNRAALNEEDEAAHAGCKTEFLGIIGIPWPAGARGPRGAPAAP